MVKIRYSGEHLGRSEIGEDHAIEEYVSSREEDLTFLFHYNYVYYEEF